ncbi:protein of unknown function [Desulfovibrio sp. 86]|nr:protein of unknown function [Desulfovibrio sp. 86]
MSRYHTCPIFGEHFCHRVERYYVSAAVQDGDAENAAIVCRLCWKKYSTAALSKNR